MSVFVISLVVWLILVFLSVMSGIEQTWLKKLTSIRAPMQITPTSAYYNSHYFLIDELSHQSEYKHKSIGEKALSKLGYPYRPELDQPIPCHWPKKITDKSGKQVDIVKNTFLSLDTLGLKFQDYEISGALFKLNLTKPSCALFTSLTGYNQGTMSQMSYISSFSGKNPALDSILESPTIDDLNHLFFLENINNHELESPLNHPNSNFAESINSILNNIKILQMETTSNHFNQLLNLIPQEVEIEAYYTPASSSASSQLIVPLKKTHKKNQSKIKKIGSQLIYTSETGTTKILPHTLSVAISNSLIFDVELYSPCLDNTTSIKQLQFKASTTLQNIRLEGILNWYNLKISKADIKENFNAFPKSPPPWLFKVNGELSMPSNIPYSVVLPSSFRNSGVYIGDTGNFSYNAPSLSSMQEHQIPIKVCGFYEPGVIPIGQKIIMSPHEVPRSINQATKFLIDPSMVNGIEVFATDLSSARDIKVKIEDSLREQNLLKYWKVTTFQDYDYIKDILQQFQSDKYLFTLIGVIVLIVACSNIITLLIILVNEKKKEIAILSSMGASKKSIVCIFTICGGFVGMFSVLIGTLTAALTLHNIDSVVHFLSTIQGRDAFNAAFFGKSLPNELSSQAVKFILITTPILSIFAGLVPAVKAAKIHPSRILRSE